MLKTIQDIADQLCLHPSTIRRYRRQMVAGIHYVKCNSRLVRYRSELIENFFQNLNDPAEHQRCIDNWLSQQPGGQPGKRRKTAWKPKTARGMSPGGSKL